MQKSELLAPFKGKLIEGSDIGSELPTSEQTQGQRQQEMTSQLIAHRQNHREIRDLPASGRPFRKENQHRSKENNQAIQPLKILDDFVHSDKETCAFELFGGGVPFHV
jgi:hypothetical protein